MVKPGVATPAKISESTRFYPYFKDCIEAFGGTHISAMIPTSDVPSYRNRKGFISQNVFAACNFDLEFMYVLSGWERSAHDSKILSNALTRHGSRLTIPEGMYLSLEVIPPNNEQANFEEVVHVGALESQQREYANN
ncbi:PREDICTED: uncharacterized protein LOC106299869 [Brassica oleracea var. oleracea]|uniref:uncharacterized protein LOC106299869 n=1 Tax=Brassica oleracea var. oleracea TaxID=109376 RepID=UPI0006A739AA|nr:PREDICTED: uncharacterized protein LOC106299869 [Brassica oleracea var. oleracea]